MAVFKLSKNTMTRLQAQFEKFQQEREKLHGLLVDYIAEYRRFQGTPQDRKEHMEKQFSQRAVTISHLIFDSDTEIYWHIQDIAILMGRDPSSISRALSSMERSDGWCSRLLILRKEAKSANGNSIYVYRQEIFDLIFDRYEEEYLLRFAKPRHSNKNKATDADEIRRFWQRLKANAQAQKERFLQQEEQIELPDIPPMSWKDILSLIWNKVFTFKTGTLASVAVAICFEISRHWPDTAPWFMAISGLTLLTCSMLLRLSRAGVGCLSSLGAVAMLFTMLWGANLYSSVEAGRLANRTGQPSHISQQGDEHRISLTPELGKGPRVNFRITSDLYDNLKEVFYRINSDDDYRSTGFTDLQYPDLLIEPQQSEGTITLDVKYIDTNEKWHGPWTYSFDLARERFELSKSFTIRQQGSWMTVYYKRDPVMLELNFDSQYADNVVKSVVLGINGNAPDTMIPVKKGKTIRYEVGNAKDIKYIMTYLIFDDGTSSDKIQGCIAEELDMDKHGRSSQGVG